MIYFISIADDPAAPVKIGHTSQDASARLAALQTGHPQRLAVLATVPGGYDVENELHRAFATDRLHGEWFRRSEAISGAIKLAGAGKDALRRPMAGKSAPEAAKPHVARARAQEAAQARKAGRPRIGEADRTLTALRPWEAAGMSRATWFRRQKEGRG